MNEKETDDLKNESAVKLNPLQRVGKVFYHPAELFRYLRMKPDFLIPLFIAILMMIVIKVSVYDISLDEAITEIEQHEKFSEEQKDRIINQVEATRYGSWRQISIYILPFLITFIFLGGVTLVYWFLGNVVLGGDASFKQLFSVLSYSSLIYAIPQNLLMILWVAYRETVKIPLNLSVFFSKGEMNNTLFYFLERMDLFSIWFLIVFSIGFSVVYRFSYTKSLIWIGIIGFAYSGLISVFMGVFW